MAQLLPYFEKEVTYDVPMGDLRQAHGHMLFPDCAWLVF